MEFDQWCDELDRICREKYKYEVDYTKETGRDCWRDYFEDGYSPEEALNEDFSYA